MVNNTVIIHASKEIDVASAISFLATKYEAKHKLIPGSVLVTILKLRGKVVCPSNKTKHWHYEARLEWDENKLL